MSRSTTPIKESLLSTDLSETAHAFIRELAMACRKMSIYGTGHPQSVRAIEKPFMLLSHILRFRTPATVNVLRGQLYVLNILLKDTVFNGQILQYLQALDVNAILFRRSTIIDEFTTLIESMVSRDKTYDPRFQLANYLREHGIESIESNSQLAYSLFEDRKQYRGDVSGDFTVRRLALDQLGSDLHVLGMIEDADPEALLKLGIDFDSSIVEYLLPERMASLSAASVRQVLLDLGRQIKTQTADDTLKEDTTNRYMRLFKLVSYHPEREKITADLEDRLKGRNAEINSGFDEGSATGAIRMQHMRRIDSLMEELFSSDNRNYDVTEFCDCFSRLLKTGQGVKARDVVIQLIDYMGTTDAGYRQKALNLVGAVIGQLNMVTDLEVLESTVATVVARMDSHRETYEYSELIWKLFAVCHSEEQYELMARLTAAMAQRRTVIDNVTVYDSMAVKKAFENISQPETVQRFIGGIIRANHEQAGYIKQILAAIGSEEIALALSRIISHPVRTVRQLTLKILAELGKASLKVYSHILMDDAMFQRDAERHELPDEKWYVIRNSIFVLGSLHDQQAVPALRARLSDTDVRVRREIAASLEKIGGEEAVDCLMVMAEDTAPEVRNAAIIAIGLVGKAEHAPLLIDIARKNPAECLKAVVALGKLSGADACAFLGGLLDDPAALADLAGGRVSRDDLRAGIIRALGQIGDREAIDKVRQFAESQSAASKLLFKNSPVNRAISEVLEKR
jgi:HEAT repeat protein